MSARVIVKQGASVLAISAAAILAVVPGYAAAQEAQASDGGDIVVTASKRTSSTIQDTPIAVQALSSAELQARASMDFADYYRSVPGVAVQDQGPGDKRYIIRGINSVGAATVGMYLDEVILTGENSQAGGGQAPDIKLFDIERVEMLKGPQGTTFGSSSMAGAIRYITTKPKLDVVEGYMQSSLRATRGASLGYQTDGAINLPIIADKLAVRVSGYYADLPGWIDNRFETGANNEKDKAVRLAARWKITDDLTLDGMAMYQYVHQDSKNYYHTTGYDGQPLTGSGYQQDDYARAPYLDKSEIYNATLAYKRPFGTFTATASRFVRDTHLVFDASLAADAYFGYDYAGEGRSILDQPKHRRVDSGEVRFASSFDGPLQVLIGAFGQNERRFFESRWPHTDGTGYEAEVPDLLLDRTVDTRIKERAIFGEVSYDFMPGLTGTVGTRIFDFKLKQISNAIVAANGGVGAGVGAPLKSKDSGVIMRFNLAYKLNDQINTYIQVAQGYRAGGTNDQTAAAIANVAIPGGYGSDSLWNYEFGVKTTLLDRKLFLNGAIYYIDWSKIQVSNLATSGTLSFNYIGNGGKADVKGAELTLDYRPISGLQLTGNVSYSPAKLTRDNPIASTGLKGDRVPYVPKWTAAAGANYTFPVNQDGLDGQLGFDVSYQGKAATQFNDTIDTYEVLKSYELVNLHAGVKKDNWSVNFVVNNLFDDSTPINYDWVVAGAYPTATYTNRPRTFVLSGSVHF